MCWFFFIKLSLMHGVKHTKRKYKVSSKSVHWEPSCSTRTDGHDEANSRCLQLSERG